MEYSGNSGSLQSSSGGDEEYESRAAGSIFMNSSTTHHPAPPTHVIGPISNPPQPPFFDPFSNYMQLLHSNMTWPRPPATSFRSDPNTINPMLSASSHALRPPPAGGEGSNNSGVSAPTVTNTNQAAAARNPRKRSRASRRAPTTVLTTDTTNFRAMVQEFTGVPAPPFIPRGGLDLFGPRSTAFETPPPPPYLRRPFSQKDNPPPQFRPSSTAADGGGGGMGGSSTQSWNLFNNAAAAEEAARWRNNNEEGYKPVGGPYNFPATTPMNGNMNYSGEKAPAAENIITARGLSEGMVESWICSSSE
ncbi:hypothetical protein MIMGU_mgv1a021604mg [Erythranthe guttata]|uniref:VQ domain-containing protein n=1 Tax=Erythranthe guttata TaxID=4155 RepID=A0A022Q7U6_ERYGU|nr:hypothetical protein MIMGU_mgv1a021604mg [Erythranthe guttata]